MDISHKYYSTLRIIKANIVLIEHSSKWIYSIEVRKIILGMLLLEGQTSIVQEPEKKKYSNKSDEGGVRREGE